MDNKGVVITFMCINPDCNFSHEKIVIKKPVSITGNNKFSFTAISSCPKCKSPVEMINFVSGTLEIEADEISKE